MGCNAVQTIGLGNFVVSSTPTPGTIFLSVPSSLIFVRVPRFQQRRVQIVHAVALLHHVALFLQTLINPVDGLLVVAMFLELVVNLHHQFFR